MSLAPSLLSVLKYIALVVVLGAAVGGLLSVGYQWGKNKETVAYNNYKIAQMAIDAKSQSELQAQIDAKQQKIDQLSLELSQAQGQVRVVTHTVIKKVHDQLLAKPSALTCQLPPETTKEINQNGATLNKMFEGSTK